MHRPEKGKTMKTRTSKKVLVSLLSVLLLGSLAHATESSVTETETTPVNLEEIMPPIPVEPRAYTENGRLYAFGINVTAQTSEIIVHAMEGSEVAALAGSTVVAEKDSLVFANKNSTVTAEKGSKVQALQHSKVTARDGSYVIADYDSLVTAEKGSTVRALYGSVVTAKKGSTINAEPGSSVTAEEGSTVNNVDVGPKLD